MIERVARSEQFSRSVRLRDFLLYVGKQSLKEGCPEINEQEIGVKVFGRPASYDRSQDNIVRVNATELRKRLESYFASDGAHEPLILDIPRGAYKPVFRQRIHVVADPPPPAPEEHPAAAQVSSEIETAAPGRSLRPFANILWTCLTLLLVSACIALFLQNRAMRRALSPWEDKPALAAFWTDFLHSHRHVDVVLPDSSLGLGQELTHHVTSLSDYLNPGYVSQIKASAISPDRKSDLDRIFAHNLVTFGDVRAAQQILALDPVSSSLRLKDSRFYQPDSMKHDNAILLGGKKANPWLYLFDDQMNFIMDSEGEGMFVANRHPKAGEQPVYTGVLNNNNLVGYGVVAFLPNPTRTGNVIIIAGTDGDATNAAAEFLTSEEQLENFRNTLHVTRFPYFEVLLKASLISGTSFNVEMAGYRTYTGHN